LDLDKFNSEVERQDKEANELEKMKDKVETFFRIELRSFGFSF